jgi:hypothetical protein
LSKVSPKYKRALWNKTFKNIDDFKKYLEENHPYSGSYSTIKAEGGALAKEYGYWIVVEDRGSNITYIDSYHETEADAEQHAGFLEDQQYFYNKIADDNEKTDFNYYVTTLGKYNKTTNLPRKKRGQKPLPGSKNIYGRKINTPYYENLKNPKNLHTMLKVQIIHK